MPVLHEPVRLFVESEVSVSEAERSHLAIDERLKLGRAPSDSVVLGEVGPVTFTSERDPLVIRYVLSALLAINLGQRPDY